MFAALVIAMTAIVLAFVLAWGLSPKLRRWVEAPKYRVLQQERRFDHEP